MTTTIELRAGNPIHDGAEIVKFRNLESETEDEEVKMNCIGRFRGVDDSEIFSNNNSSDDDGDDDDNKLSDDDENPNKERYDDPSFQMLLCNLRPSLSLILFRIFLFAAELRVLSHSSRRL